MRVHKISLKNAMKHDSTELLLDDTGVTVLLGTNGSGKSTLIEGVSVSCWGESLRGTPIFRRDTAGAVSTETDLGTFEHAVSAKGARKLSFTLPGEAEPTKGDTPTKTIKMIQNIVGDHDIWRRTHVLSSADAASFSTATDAQRKALVESMLGLDKFDSALKACRAQLGTAKVQSQLKAQALEANRRHLEAERRSLAESVEPTLVVPTAPILGSDISPERRVIVESLVADLTAKSREASASLTARSFDVKPTVPKEVSSAVFSAQADLRVAEQTKARLASGVCSVCSRPWAGEAVANADAELTAARQRLAAAQEALSAAEIQVSTWEALRRTSIEAEADALRDIEAQLRRSDLELQGMVRDRAVWEQFSRHAADAEARHQALHAAWSAKNATALGRIHTLQVASADLADECFLLSREVDELAACEKVLGVKGVRVRILDGALAAIEILANDILVQRRDGALKVHLKSETALAKGGSTDAISIEVEGAGGGYGYKATSGGERRWLDIGLLLASAQVSAEAHGQKPGTLFIDEVFDALDLDACETVASILDDLGRERNLVVITHREELAEMLRALGAKIHVVDEGRLR